MINKMDAIGNRYKDTCENDCTLPMSMCVEKEGGCVRERGKCVLEKAPFLLL